MENKKNQVFKGYINDIEYLSDEYINLIHKKMYLSYCGYIHHEHYFDVMKKGDINFYINKEKTFSLIKIN